MISHTSLYINNIYEYIYVVKSIFLTQLYKSDSNWRVQSFIQMKLNRIVFLLIQSLLLLSIMVENNLAFSDSINDITEIINLINCIHRTTEQKEKLGLLLNKHSRLYFIF